MFKVFAKNTESETITETHSKASNAGLKLAVQTLNVIKKSKPHAPRKTITHTTDDATLSKQADALAEWANAFKPVMQEWQARYNDALDYLRSYPSTWNLELPSGNRANGAALAQFFTDGGFIEDKKFISKL